MRSLIALLVALGLFSFVWKTAAGQDVAPMAFARETLHLGKCTLDVELADDAAKGERGLMYREHLGDNQGMLFILPIGQATFWMKNTLIPLSVAYIDRNGVILEIHDMRPHDETITASESREVAFALEMNLHWFSLNGIKPGDKINPVPKPITAPYSN